MTSNIDNIIIRKITSDEVDMAMQLALEVFMQFEGTRLRSLGCGKL